MKNREFNKLARIQFGKRKAMQIDLTDAQKHDMLLYIVRNRKAIHKSLVTPLLDRSWLNCMGYLYSDETFIHTGETKLGI